MIEELGKISLNNEVWLKYKTCERTLYFVSNKGRFVSIIGINPNRSKGRYWKIKLIAPYPNKKGYMLVRTNENKKDISPPITQSSVIDLLSVIR